MKRGYLFATALATAIITFASLSAIFGRTSFRHYGHHHSYCNYYDERYHDGEHRRQKPAGDSTRY